MKLRIPSMDSTNKGTTEALMDDAKPENGKPEDAQVGPMVFQYFLENNEMAGWYNSTGCQSRYMAMRWLQCHGSFCCFGVSSHGRWHVAFAWRVRENCWRPALVVAVCALLTWSAWRRTLSHRVLGDWTKCCNSKIDLMRSPEFFCLLVWDQCSATPSNQEFLARREWTQLTCSICKNEHPGAMVQSVGNGQSLCQSPDGSDRSHRQGGGAVPWDQNRSPGKGGESMKNPQCSQFSMKFLQPRCHCQIEVCSSCCFRLSPACARMGWGRMSKKHSFQVLDLMVCGCFVPLNLWKHQRMRQIGDPKLWAPWWQLITWAVCSVLLASWKRRNNIYVELWMVWRRPGWAWVFGNTSYGWMVVWELVWWAFGGRFREMLLEL